MRPEILKKITGNTHHTKVNLANLDINDEELLEVLNTLKQLNPDVSVIDLDNNHLGDKGAQILYEQLRQFNNIKEIGLQYNEIGKEGALVLFRLKQIFSSLDILFHGNKISDVGEMDEIEQLAMTESLRP
ncbi:hypothetical protein Lmor_2557 [Legionella moravica]|uniref:Ran GTPase-activating protein (RanGAP) involved in mRNA processing and transport n=1 Tax=Legionella moravica TaxID=39962 RepID=A0A378JYY4_9GAMM|nr:hypothetical protein [Legionella moravica]KTD31681.1 hypothetical protein Lmor_2557 [Legionella moravica]STX62239.1 Ran GTPase-activating protein (RanGAP) involved in mRNA processing and transport [Legionella moravica]